MTGAALLDEFVRHLRVERGLSPCTWQSYSYQVRGYLRFLDERRRAPAAATREDVLDYMEARKRSGSAGSTLFASTIAIRQFHRFMAERGHAPSEPTAGLKLPKYRQRLPEPLSVAGMERLLSFPVGGKFHRIRMKAALELLYSTGMRISELLGLRASSMDLDEGWVRVLGKGGKERVAPVGPGAREALLRYLETREKRFPAAAGPLFLTSRGRPWSRTAFWWQLRHLARRAGIAGSVFPHRLRHTCASHMLAGGAQLRELAELLGHASVVSTAHYAHVSVEHLRCVCARSHPAFRRSGGL